MYDLTSPLKSTGVGTQQQWEDALSAHTPAPANASEIVAAYIANGVTYGINHDLAIAQACDECAFFTDYKWTDTFNPCGLGVTDRSVPGPNFVSADRGIAAHYQHLCCHAYEESACPAERIGGIIDPRHSFHLNQTQVQEIQNAQYRWAAGIPGGDPLDYIRTIVGIANGATSVSTPITPSEEYPTPAEMGFSMPLRIEPTDFVGPDRTPQDVSWFVVHDTEGHYEGDIAVLTHGSRSGSIHLIIGREDGQACFSVPISQTAWAAGNDALGAKAIQVELSKAPDEQGYTDWQYNTLSRYFWWCQRQGMAVEPTYIGPHPEYSGFLLTRGGIIGHSDIPDGSGGWGGFAHHTDPGDQFDWPRLVRLIGLQGDVPITPPPFVPPPIPPPVGPTTITEYFDQTTKHLVGGGFYQYFLKNGGLSVLGRPLTEEYQGIWPDDPKGAKPRTMQVFEGLVLGYFPENNAPFDIQRLRLGAKFAAEQGFHGPGITVIPHYTMQAIRDGQGRQIGQRMVAVKAHTVLGPVDDHLPKSAAAHKEMHERYNRQWHTVHRETLVKMAGEEYVDPNKKVEADE